MNLLCWSIQTSLYESCLTFTAKPDTHSMMLDHCRTKVGEILYSEDLQDGQRCEVKIQLYQ
jgi:hypothetical protein